MDNQLYELRVENFRSLRKVTIPLGPLNVMVGANGAGKSNVLEVVRFLADVIRTDLEPALASRNGFEALVFRGGGHRPATMKIGIKASWTRHGHEGAPDEYELRVTDRADRPATRQESFTFKRTAGRGRRITITGERAVFIDVEADGSQTEAGGIGLERFSSGLSTLSRLAEPELRNEEGDREPARVAESLASLRVFEVDVAAARLASRMPRRGREPLDDGAANLAAFLLALRSRAPVAWETLRDDARAVLPQLEDLDVEYPSGATREVVVVLHERGLRQPTQLGDASYGTIRLLALLALVHDPDPPAMTCVEEIDHGLHPQALELLVTRLREASTRTQFLIATHSPALADRLRPAELIVCERLPDGSSHIPAMSTSRMEEVVRASDDEPLGELWFSGALGGDL